MHLEADYPAFGAVLCDMAAENGWQFAFRGQSVPAAQVFAADGFGPALLALTETELAARHIAVDLGVRYVDAPGSVLGYHVAFMTPTEAGPFAALSQQMWRLVATSLMVEQMPSNEAVYQLDVLCEVLRPQVASADAGVPA